MLLSTTVGALRDALDIARSGLPAESAMRMVPIVHMFCVTESGLCYAYDDILLAVSPVQMPKGAKLKTVAVSRLLWDLLQGFPPEKELTLAHEKGTKGVKLSVGRLRADIPVLDEKDFLLSSDDATGFDKSAVVKIRMSELGNTAASGLSFCIDCFSFNPAVPAQSGIVMRAEGKSLSFYATDNVSLTKFSVKLGEKVTTALQSIVPPRFFTELMRLRGLLTDKQWSSGTLTMGKSVIAARFGSVLLASKVKVLAGIDMDAVLVKHRQKEAAAAKVSPALVDAVTRARLILGDTGGVVKVTPATPKGARVEAEVDGVGQAAERCPMWTVSSEFSVDCAKLLRALARCETLAESKSALIFTADDGHIVHLLSKSSK